MEERDEAADVRVVERCLDLVEQVEGAGPRQKQREQEGDRAERLLASGEERQPCDATARGAELDLYPGLVLVRSAELPLSPRKEGRRDLGEVALDRRIRLLEPTLDGLGQLRAQALELLERALQVLALPHELAEPL